MKRTLRATLRTATLIAATPVIAAMTLAQSFIIGPLTGNYTLVPKLVNRGLAKLLGYKIVFNKASVPVVKDKPAWFVANHQSIADFIILGSVLKGTFAGKGDILKWPFVAQMARAVNYIGFRRSAEYNPQSRAKLIDNFNGGYNTIMFPEATSTKADKVYLFRAPLLTVAFGDKGVKKENARGKLMTRLFGAKKIHPEKQVVSLNNDLVVQPMAIRVLEVEGQNAVGVAEQRDKYSMFNEPNIFKCAWAWMKIRDMKIEVTALPPLDPNHFGKKPDMTEQEMIDASRKLINAAALSVAEIVNPGQTTFEKAEIPGQKPKVAA